MNKPDVIVDFSGHPSESLDEMSKLDIEKAIIEKKAFDDRLFALSVRDAKGQRLNAVWATISNPNDLHRVVKIASGDYDFVVIECTDWKVIPLENLIAEFRRTGKKLYSVVKEPSEIGLTSTILERGVDGIVISPELVSQARKLFTSSSEIHLSGSTVTRIVDVGLGDRVCLDTTSQLAMGEGMLIGSKGGYFFLVHGETIENQYIATRPFRVNAGAIHSYVLTPGLKTRYLSEFSAGDRVLVIQTNGGTRETVVGRVKMEKRPMVLIEVTHEGETGSIILQNAETVRLVRVTGEPVSVMELKQGDEVLTAILPPKARHLGGEVDEFIIER